MARYRINQYGEIIEGAAVRPVTGDISSVPPDVPCDGILESVWASHRRHLSEASPLGLMLTVLIVWPTVLGIVALLAAAALSFAVGCCWAIGLFVRALLRSLPE